MKEKIGLYIGRFQPFHKGHLSVVKEAVNHCDTLIIAVGSAQESRTKKNPFSFEERKVFIWRCLWAHNKQIIIVPIEDRKNYGDDGSWGQYVLDCVEKECGLRPTINFEGGEECRSTWFDGIDIERVVIDRTTVPISATQLRKAIVDDDYDGFVSMAHNGLWMMYGKMRRVLLEVEQ